MSHHLTAIIGKNKIVAEFANEWIQAELIELPQDFSMIKITDLLFDDINELVNNKSEAPYSEFYFLSSSLHEILIGKSVKIPIAYLETDYFGGNGYQAALLYENGIAASKPRKTIDKWDSKLQKYIQTPPGARAINTILKSIGVFCHGKLDEFDSLRLGYYR